MYLPSGISAVKMLAMRSHFLTLPKDLFLGTSAATILLFVGLLNAASVPIFLRKIVALGRTRPPSPPIVGSGWPPARCHFAPLSWCSFFLASLGVRSLRVLPKKDNALGRTRTCNLVVRSHLLYPLSYERA